MVEKLRVTGTIRLFSCDEVVQILGTRLNAHLMGCGDRIIKKIVTDSRRAEPDTLFVALAGERTDGHNFIEEMLKKRCAVMISSQFAEKNRERLHELLHEGIEGGMASGRPSDTAHGAAADTAGAAGAIIIVKDPLQGLQILAQQWIAHHPDLCKIAITGSNGKSSLKEMLFSIFCRHYGTDTVFATRGNHNSDIGLPLECFRLASRHRVGVFEMGMNRKGEIGELAEVVHPDWAIITNIGTAHIGKLGSAEAILREKKDIFSCFDGNQTGLIYDDEPYREELAAGIHGEILYYGEQTTAGYEHSSTHGIDGNEIEWNGHTIHLKLAGAPQVRNALAAITLAQKLTISDQDIVAGLEAVVPMEGRCRILRNDTITIIDDGYNASPESMTAALKLLSESAEADKRVCILGAMHELGTHEERFHHDVVDSAIDVGCRYLILIGDTYNQSYREKAGQLPPRRHLKQFRTVDEAARWLLNSARENRDGSEDFDAVNLTEKGNVILIKGSRAERMETLIPILLKREPSLC